MQGHLVKKILTCLWYSYSRKIEVIFLYYRIEYSYIRLDYKIFADFLCLFLREHRISLLLALVAVPHLTIWIFQKIQIGGKRNDLDRSALPRIFSDLLSNAAKYSDGDSSILLTKSGEIQQVWNWIS